MPFSNLSQTLAMQTIPLDGCMVELQRSATDALAFEAGAPHSGAHPFDDQVAFEFGDGADDDNDSPSQRTGSVDVLSEADVLDVEAVELVEDIEEVFD